MMQQKGRDDQGILGFLSADIEKEVKRGKRLVSFYLYVFLVIFFLFQLKNIFILKKVFNYLIQKIRIKKFYYKKIHIKNTYEL